VPKPKPGESEDDYVSRCIPIVLNEGTTDDSSQAAATCHSMWQEERGQAGGRAMGREYKSFPALAVKAGDQGEVETIFAVFGNVDEGGDMIHPGAFAKTFTERGNKIMVLDAHNAGSVRDVIGKPVSLQEIGRDALPEKILQEYPMATGGALARVQFLMDTPEGEGAFKRIKAGAVSEWSFGYDVLDHDFSEMVHNGQKTTVRNLRTLKLYEISPVLWGMNPATMTTGAKSANETNEDKGRRHHTVAWHRCWEKLKPKYGRDSAAAICTWSLSRSGTVYRSAPIEAEQKQTGDGRLILSLDEAYQIAPLLEAEMEAANITAFLIDPETWELTPVFGEEGVEGVEGVEGAMGMAIDPESKEGRILAARNASRAAAALTALMEILEDAGVDTGWEKRPPQNEDDKGKAIASIYLKEMTEAGPITHLGDVLNGAVHKFFTMLADNIYIEGYLSRDERIALSSAIGIALDALANAVSPDVAERLISTYIVQDTFKGKSAPREEAAIPQAQSGAGPSPTPTLEQKRLQVLLDIESLT